MTHEYRNFSCKVFPGFYESILYNSDTLYNFEYGEEIPEGYYFDFTGDGWKKFKEETCKDWVYAMQDSFDENPIDMKIGDYHSLWSPREYNYTTDKIEFPVTFNLNKLKSYCWHKRKDDFNKYLYDHWSDRDGFWSFIPNNLERFKREYYENKSKDSFLDVMVEWYLLENMDFDRVISRTMDNYFERIYENICLEKDGEWTHWNFWYNNDTNKYEVGEQIKETA